MKFLVASGWKTRRNSATTSPSTSSSEKGQQGSLRCRASPCGCAPDPAFPGSSAPTGCRCGSRLSRMRFLRLADGVRQVRRVYEADRLVVSRRVLAVVEADLGGVGTEQGVQVGHAVPLVFCQVVDSGDLACARKCQGPASPPSAFRLANAETVLMISSFKLSSVSRGNVPFGRRRPASLRSKCWPSKPSSVGCVR